MITKLNISSFNWKWLIALIPLPLPFILPKSIVFMLGLAFIFAVFVLSWDLVAGYTGEVNLGHTVFIGIGAYTSALLALKFHTPPLISIVAGGLLAMLFGFVIGIICLRLKGYYLALVTAILPLVFIQFVNIYSGIFGGYEGLSIGIKNALHRSIEGRYYIAYGFMLLSIYAVYRLVNGKFGLRLKAIRDDEELAEGAGIDVVKHKVMAFCISALMAGLAGGVVVFYRLSVGVDLFGVPLMILIILSALFGGLGTLFGPLIGALTIYIAKHWIFMEAARAINVQQADELMMYLLLIVLILKMPDGLFGWLKSIFGKSDFSTS